MKRSEQIAAEIWNDLQDVPKTDYPQIERRLLEQTDKPIIKRFVQVLFDLKERL
ncbi:MAG: hypothetical protein LUE65_01095 [Clostridiales bacterium]|nr:hypothetical protein [Clostridiales bacterium]